MHSSQIIEVPLPNGAVPNDADLALIKAACRSVVSLCLDTHHDWFTQLRQLEGEEWRVDWGLLWSAEATKGRCSEAVTAPTIDEAFERLSNLARLHKVEGCP